MIVIFGDGVPELFAELPGKVKIKAAHSIERLGAYPHMLPSAAARFDEGLSLFCGRVLPVLLPNQRGRDPD